MSEPGRRLPPPPPPPPPFSSLPDAVFEKIASALSLRDMALASGTDRWVGKVLRDAGRPVEATTEELIQTYRHAAAAAESKDGAAAAMERLKRRLRDLLRLSVGPALVSLLAENRSEGYALLDLLGAATQLTGVTFAESTSVTPDLLTWCERLFTVHRNTITSVDARRLTGFWRSALTGFYGGLRKLAHLSALGLNVCLVGGEAHALPNLEKLLRRLLRQRPGLELYVTGDNTADPEGLVYVAEFLEETMVPRMRSLTLALEEVEDIDLLPDALHSVLTKAAPHLERLSAEVSLDARYVDKSLAFLFGRLGVWPYMDTPLRMPRLRRLRLSTESRETHAILEDVSPDDERFLLRGGLWATLRERFPALESLHLNNQPVLSGVSAFLFGGGRSSSGGAPPLREVHITGLTKPHRRDTQLVDGGGEARSLGTAPTAVVLRALLATHIRAELEAGVALLTASGTSAGAYRGPHRLTLSTVLGANARGTADPPPGGVDALLIARDGLRVRIFVRYEGDASVQHNLHVFLDTSGGAEHKGLAAEGAPVSAAIREQMRLPDSRGARLRDTVHQQLLPLLSTVRRLHTLLRERRVSHTLDIEATLPFVKDLRRRLSRAVSPVEDHESIYSSAFYQRQPATD